MIKISFDLAPIEDLPIVIMTADHQMACLPAFCYLFNKFWPKEVQITVIGYKMPTFDLPKNVKYVSLGEDRGAEKWSNDMIEYFSNFEHDLFFLTTEDGFILRDANEMLLTFAHSYSRYLIEQNPNFLRFNLTHCVSTRPHDIIAQPFTDAAVILSRKGVDYRHSLQHSIWSTKNFLSMLSPDMTPWQVELDEEARESRFDIVSYAGNVPLNVGHGYMKGKKVLRWYDDVWRNMNGFPGLNKKDVEYIENMGWVPEINVPVKRDGGGRILG